MLTICNNILSLRIMISSSKTLFSVNSLSVIIFSLIKFIEVTLVHKIIQVSSVQVNKTSSAHCIMCYHLNSFRLSPLSHLCPSPPNPSVPFPSGFHHTAICVYMYVCVCMYAHTHACIACMCIWHVCIDIYAMCVCDFFFAQSLLSSSPPNSPPLWQLSVCFMYPCLSFYFVHQLILFIRFHM